MIATYAIVSAALLAFTAAIWSTNGPFNIAVKAVFCGASLLGAVVIARVLAL